MKSGRARKPKSRMVSFKRPDLSWRRVERWDPPSVVFPLSYAFRAALLRELEDEDSEVGVRPPPPAVVAFSRNHDGITTCSPGLRFNLAFRSGKGAMCRVRKARRHSEDPRRASDVLTVRVDENWCTGDGVRLLHACAFNQLAGICLSRALFVLHNHHEGPLYGISIPKGAELHII